MKILRRSLWASGLSLLLCLMLLAGTTLAWFTDSVTNKGNVITAGNLSIDAMAYDVDMTTGNKSFTIPNFNGGNAIKFEATGEDLKGEGCPAIINESLWEPGKSNAKLLEVENSGTLAAKIKLQFNITDNGLMNALWFDFVQVDEAGNVTGTFQERPMSDLATFAKDLELPLAANGGMVRFILVYGMYKDASSVYMNKSFGADVTILATQAPVEADGFGNTDYDAAADPLAVFGEEIRNRLDDPAVTEVVIGENIDMNNPIFDGAYGNDTFVIPDGKTLDLNGYSFIRPGGGSGNGLAIEEGSTVVVKNGTLYNEGDMTLVDVEYGGTVTFENVAFIGHGDNAIQARASGSGEKITMVFKECTFENAAVILKGMNGASEVDVTFIDCTFTGTYKMYDDEGNALTDPYGHIHYTTNLLDAENRYLYGSVKFQNCSFDLDCSEASYKRDILALYGYDYDDSGKMLTVTLENVTMTGENVTPVSVDSRYDDGLTLIENNATYTVGGVSVDYAGNTL